MDRIYSFATALASCARLFTVSQLARHPDLVWYSDPSKRTREWLALHKDIFEAIPEPVGAEKKTPIDQTCTELKTPEDAISGLSRRAEHWLGIDDIWDCLNSRRRTS